MLLPASHMQWKTKWFRCWWESRYGNLICIHHTLGYKAGILFWVAGVLCARAASEGKCCTTKLRRKSFKAKIDGSGVKFPMFPFPQFVQWRSVCRDSEPTAIALEPDVWALWQWWIYSWPVAVVLKFPRKFPSFLLNHCPAIQPDCLLQNPHQATEW